jgi:hypothetical protein
MSDLVKKRSNLSTAFRCVLAFIGLCCLYGLLTVALVFAAKGRMNALSDFAMFFLNIAFGIGLSYLIAYFAAEFGHPIMRNWKLKLVMGIGIGTVVYYGYGWLLAVCILPAWYFFWYRRGIK